MAVLGLEEVIIPVLEELYSGNCDLVRTVLLLYELIAQRWHITPTLICKYVICIYN